MSARALLRDRKQLRDAFVCEVGCGTAALSVLAMKLGAESAVGIDCDPRAVHLARRTAAANGVRMDLRRGDLLLGLKGRFDVLLANLPQKPSLREDGGALLRRFLSQSRRRLKPGGRLYLFAHSLAPMGALAKGFRGFRVEVAFWRRRHAPPGEYPPGLIRHWLGLAERGLAVFHSRPGRRGWHTFHAVMLVATRS